MTFQTKEQSWMRHFQRNEEGEVVNSRKTKFEMAKYDVDFMNYIFDRPLISSRQPEEEISKQKYYYAVVKGKDYGDWSSSCRTRELLPAELVTESSGGHSVHGLPDQVQLREEAG